MQQPIHVMAAIVAVSITGQVAHAQRGTSTAPDIPTMAESGVRGYEHVLKNVVMVSSQTPAGVVAQAYIRSEVEKYAKVVKASACVSTDDSLHPSSSGFSRQTVKFSAAANVTQAI